MLRKLSALSSRFSFSNSNYNYDNTNTNVSSHLCNYCSIDLARMAKNNKLNERLEWPRLVPWTELVVRRQLNDLGMAAQRMLEASP